MRAIQLAKRRNPATSASLFDFVASVLLLVAIIGAVALSRRHLSIGEGQDEATEDVP